MLLGERTSERNHRLKQMMMRIIVPVARGHARDRGAHEHMTERVRDNSAAAFVECEECSVLDGRALRVRFGFSTYPWRDTGLIFLLPPIQNLEPVY